jgi:predicted CoA-binding protein
MSPSFDLSRYQDPATIQRVLHSAKTVAVVGLSKNELRASYFVAFYLRRHGYRVIPVNPREPEILGETSYKSLTDLSEPVDIVNVFRAPDALPAIADDAVAIGAKNLWCQFTVINEEGGRIAATGSRRCAAGFSSGTRPVAPGAQAPTVQKEGRPRSTEVGLLEHTPLAQATRQA